ncbi:MarR family transcriptional regulator [Candidatus Woesearchaeota archaeon]|jgi:DNA-binding MarR family transcriptional regulator|nr:MarR family transcriptional regulator [Candidatus Woesearchaeota archaeon]
MNQKHIGIVLIIVGILVFSLVLFNKSREDFYVNQIIEERNSCFLEDGTCLHDLKTSPVYIAGYAMAIALFLFGIYLTFIDKTQEILIQTQSKIATAVKDSSKKEKFEAFVAGFEVDEQNVLKAIHEQDGIQQSTLRYRTGISKSTLSLILKSLEERNFITKKPSGKTNKVFLRKKY